jgi:PIN domain nuclease of toxin-antitoxin system
LPLHHRDLFERLLVAKSISESLLLVSADGAFDAYGCPLQDAHR